LNSSIQGHLCSPKFERTMAENRKKELDQIKKDLFSSESSKVISALKMARDKGDHSLIDPLLTLFLNEKDEAIRGEIQDMLSTLKISKAEKELEKALINGRFAEIRGFILSFMWSSGMNPSGSIKAICQAAVEGDFATALEALTLMENMEGPFDETELMEANLQIRQGIEDSKDSEKLPLLRSMFQLLSNAEERD
jgi:hypothetical protein